MKRLAIFLLIIMLLFTGCGKSSPGDILAKADPVVIEKYNSYFPEIEAGQYYLVDHYRSSDYDKEIAGKFDILKMFIEKKHGDDPKYAQQLEDVFADKIEKYKEDVRAQAEIDYVDYINDVNAALDAAGIKPDPGIGMTSDAVLSSSWGSPQEKNITETAEGKSEQWVYRKGYIYIDNGVVTAIQTTE